MTTKQRDLIDRLRDQNNLTRPMLDWWVRTHYGGTVDDLTVRQASEVIETMKTWKGSPADVQRAFGQTVLPGVEL
jgi:hypothetical protein